MIFSNNIDDHFMESAPNARARFSCLVVIRRALHERQILLR